MCTTLHWPESFLAREMGQKQPEKLTEMSCYGAATAKEYTLSHPPAGDDLGDAGGQQPDDCDDERAVAKEPTRAHR